MSKFKLLGILNLAFGILPLAFLIDAIDNPPPHFNLNTLIHKYTPDTVLLIALIINIYLVIKLLWRKDYVQNQFKQYLILTLHTIFWFLWLFLGYFFVSEFIYPLISLVLIAGIFIFVKRLSLKLAIITSLVTILVVILTITFSFEEDYCWKKGEEMAVGKPTMMSVPVEDARRVFGSAIGIPSSDSAQVGRAAYYHFQCHQTLDFNSALKEKYLSPE